MSAAPTKIKRDTNLGPCLLIEILLSHSLWPAAPFACALGKFGVQYMSGWGNWNQQVGHLNFHGFFALAYLSSGVFDSSSPLCETIGRPPLSRQAQVAMTAV